MHFNLFLKNPITCLAFLTLKSNETEMHFGFRVFSLTGYVLALYLTCKLLSIKASANWSNVNARVHKVWNCKIIKYTYSDICFKAKPTEPVQFHLDVRHLHIFGQIGCCHTPWSHLWCSWCCIPHRTLGTRCHPRSFEGGWRFSWLWVDGCRWRRRFWKCGSHSWKKTFNKNITLLQIPPKILI